MKTWLLRLALCAPVAGGVLGLAPAAWAEPASKCNVPIEMSDGIVLRANVVLPEAEGRFPTALTATGYNKDATNPTGTNCSSGGGLASVDQDLLEAGYAVMLLDDRGTGASEGRWDSWGQRTQDDYGEVLDWIQKQEWSDSQVGTTGGSYMGITSLLLALEDAERVARGKRRAVKAVWADVPMADAYRDVTFHGGALDSGFMPLWLGLTSGLSDIPPSNTLQEPGEAVPNYAGHLQNNFDFAASRLVDATLGGDSAYDGPFYRLRSPVERAASLKIPIAWTGGWWDIFQRGEPLLYEQLKNSKQRKFWMGANYHGAPANWEEQGIGSESEVRVRWFDRWLKGKRNGVDRLPPVNLRALGADEWQKFPRWPVPGTDYTRYHLSGEPSGSAGSLNDGSLAPAAPAQGDGDEAPLLPASSPCSRLTAQWTAGSGRAGPCETDNRTYEAHSLTYTTPPLEKDTQITGLISASVWAELTKPDATLVAVLSDVAPSGQSTQITAGFLLASQRALDRGKSTRGPRGEIVRPWHPFTKESQEPVPPNDPQEYAIEIYPTSNVFAKGHRIRLTIATANTPTTSTPLPALADQAGGQIRVLRGGQYASNVLLPLVEAR